MKLKIAIRKLIFSSSLYNLYLLKNNYKDIVFTPKDAWPGDPELGDKFVQGHYNIARKKNYSPDDTIWNIPEDGSYWTKEIHSFSWLRHLKARSGPLARKHARFLISEWLKLYESWDYDTWEIEILARRVSAWLINIDFLLADKDQEFSNLLITNIKKELKHLNFYLSKNYLNLLKKKFGLEVSSVKKMKILRCLLLSSVCFEKEQKKYNRYIKFLETEVKNYFNEEGVHFSKSPSTQLSILGDLVTIREAIISGQLEVPEFLTLIIRKAAHSLRFFRNNKGTFAIFNGSKQESKFLIDKILNLADGKARGRGPSSLTISGFEKLDSQNITVFVDTCKYYNGSAAKAPHALEINLGKNRLLGSCGTIFEKELEWKNSLLSSSAHSSLTIENTDPIFNYNTCEISKSKRFKQNGSEVIQLVHYGYQKKFSAICSRTIELGNNGKNLAILDQIHTNKLLKFTIRFHFNPYVKISLSLDKKKSIIILNDQGWIFSFDGNAELSLEHSIFINDSGRVIDTNQLLLQAETVNENTDILWGLTKEK